MRQVISGSGADTTLAVQALLLGNNQPLLSELYEIGTPYRPFAPTRFLLTSYGGPLLYNPPSTFVPNPGDITPQLVTYYGAPGLFVPSVIKRDQLVSQFGLGSQTCKVTWTPLRTQTYRVPNDPELPLEDLFALFARGAFNNGSVRIWRVYMPTPGDAATLGAMALFLGRIADIEVGDDGILITAKTYLDALEEKIPRYTIQPGARVSQQGQLGSPGAEGELVYGGALILAGTTRKRLKTNGTLQTAHTLAGGYASLANGSMQILDNSNDGTNNFLELVKPLAYLPVPGDAVNIWMPWPQNNQGNGLPGFPYVPIPENQV